METGAKSVQYMALTPASTPPYFSPVAKVWLNGTAGSPLVYDFRWGGVVTCGCAYKEGKGCTNSIGPYDCPGLSDPGLNFGLGFYNDHHFHFGKTGNMYNRQKPSRMRVYKVHYEYYHGFGIWIFCERQVAASSVPRKFSMCK